MKTMQTEIPREKRATRSSRAEHGSSPGSSLLESGALSDTAQTISMLAGGATVGVLIGGPIGAVIGAGIGVALGLGATGHLPARG